MIGAHDELQTESFQLHSTLFVQGKIIQLLSATYIVT